MNHSTGDSSVGSALLRLALDEPSRSLTRLAWLVQGEASSALPGLPADLLPPVSPRSRDARFRDSDARFRVSIEVAHSSVAALEEIVRPVAKPVLVVLNLDVVTNFAPDFSRY